MAAARTLASNKTAAVTANADNTMEKSSSTSSSAVFFVHRTRRRVAEAWTATQDRLKKDPILLWIPLLFLFLLLAVAAYWWLLRSEGSSAEPPTHTAYLLTSSLTNAVSSLPANAWHGTVAGASWLGETSLAGLAWVWGSLVGLMGWMWGWVVWVGTAVGSWVLAGLTFLLNCLYLVWDWCEYLFVAALSLLSSLGSVLSAYLLPLPASNDTDTDTETQAAWSLGTWVDSAAWVGWAGRAWGAVVNAGTSLQTGVWEAWLWLVLTLAQALNAVSAAFLWLVTGVWGAVVWVATTLWELLVALVALGSTGATTLATTVVQVSNSVAETAILVMVPLFSASRVVKEAPEGKMVPPTAPPVPAAVPSVASVEEVVQRVLDSPQLKLFISSASHDSSKGQLTLDQVSSLVKSVVEGEVGALRTETQAWRVELEAQHSTQAHTSTSNIAALQQQQKHLLHQLDELGAGLARLEDSVEGGQKEREAARAQYQEQLEALRQEMQQLSHTLHSLQDNQTVLAGVVGRCCQNASLTVEDVERHVTRLLARVLGTPDDPAAPQPSPDALAAWLKTYFVAKEELEGRLSSLTASLQPEEGSEGAAAAATQAAVAQSTQVIMDTVVERLQGEVTRVAQQQVGQQVQVQVEAAAAVLATQLTEQLDRQLASSKKQLQDGVGATVELAVGEQLGATLSASVAEAVSDAVAQALPGAVTAALPDHVQAAVSGTLPAAVDVAVAQAISQAVGAAVAPAVEVAVTGAVEAAVIKAVGTAVPGAVTQQLPALVTAAVKETIAVQVQEAVAVAVPEVVASQLSANLATAVNNSVAAALNSDTHTAQVVGVAGGRLVDEGGFSATVNLSHGGGVAGLNASAVERIVKEALRTYDADRTGMVDHALESAGGNIISTRCTESYQVHQAELSILGFTIYRYSTNNPRTIIQPDRMPGQCWAFKGSQGYIVIRLAAFVRPTAFTLEHIPRSLSPTGEIDSAPREFEVWGLQTENDEGILLGRYEYLKTGEPLQSFPVVGDNLDYFPLVELKILNNHGNLHYTCLYRFRVHGVRKI